MEVRAVSARGLHFFFFFHETRCLDVNFSLVKV